MTTPRLSFIQALRAGRHIVPGYITGALVKLQTQKELDVIYESGEWYRRLREEEYSLYDEFGNPRDKSDGYLYDGEWKSLGMNFQPEVGAACALGAAAVAMGCDLSEMADTENATFYAHPDFFEDPEDRRDHPEGFIFHTGRMAPAKLRRAKYPCVCATTPHPTWDASSNTIPEIIAHLNDRHDPRRFEQEGEVYGMRKEREIERGDQWTEDRIVSWLRSMGFNGDHKA